MDPDLSSASCLWHLSDESGLGNLSQLLVFPSEPKFLCPNTSVEREHSEMCPASPDRLLQAGRAPERLPLPIPGWHSLKTSIAHVKIKASLALSGAIHRGIAQSEECILPYFFSLQSTL